MSAQDSLLNGPAAGASKISSARLRLLFLLLCLIFVFCTSLLLGRYPHPGFMSIKLLETDEMALSILYARLPRLIVAAFLGCVLAVSGLVMQMIFCNPLVEPGFLGVSQGAAFGAGLAIVCFGSLSSDFSLGFKLAVQVSSAFFAMLALCFSCFIAHKIRFGSWVLRLILSGICVSAVFASFLSIVKYTADPSSQLAEITFWLLGSVDRASWGEVAPVAAVSVICLSFLFLFRWRLNLLSLNDKTAFSLGVNTSLERLAVLVFSVVSVAVLTAVCGLVSWVGLITPHLSRRIFGADARFALPGAMLLGALIVLICDDICRVLLPYEIPLGVATSLFGAFFFAVVMTHGPAKVKK